MGGGEALSSLGAAVRGVSLGFRHRLLGSDRVPTLHFRRQTAGAGVHVWS